ncbi:ATP-dependent endonuclease [Leptotrichia trevisanii]|uniref:ATP-dependent nuclease n=1 Tax=Leptotrichia trevisanii TaxID=109328 RepID=UPI0026F182BE|nr:AAA family ATPase [Leptotrichia trevisanii]
MYLSKVILKNFRKFKYLEVAFKDGLNVLIGENDSGKTTIIDAIRIALGTQSNEYYKLEERDFNDKNEELIIECDFKFREREENKASHFVEWITFDENQNKNPVLKIKIKAVIEKNRIKRKILAGEEGVESNFDLLDDLRVTYLKPLRDADNELIAKRNSRLSQILRNHSLFLDKEKNHPFIEKVKKFNDSVNEYFEKEGKNIIEIINRHLDNFLGKERKGDYNTSINITENDLISILNSLNLKVSENKVGLGTLNQLYMALELLLFSSEIENNILNLCLIEEIEAHLHPQAQLRTIKHLQDEINEDKQLILTTHSVILASSIKLENLILCKNDKVYPLGSEYTKLSKEDYKFLEIFLDLTKSNLFFAKGVIFVEGDAENVLVPTIAEIIGKSLYKYGVSVVNLGSLAFPRYSKIFLRKDESETLDIPVAIITDLDVKEKSKTQGFVLKKEVIEKLNKIIEKNDKNKNLNDFENSIYLDQKEIKKEIREILCINSLFDGMGKIIEKMKKENVNIEDYRKRKKERREKLYSKKNIKTFVNLKQTLEYDLAMSELGFYLNNAILETKGEKKLTQKEFEDNFKEKEKIAENIFTENFYNKDGKKTGLSKAMVALNLSEILKEKSKCEKEEIAQILFEDKYIKYIIDAINYVIGDEIK